MWPERERRVAWGRIAVVALLVLVACGRTVPSGPQPVAWDRQACAHCRMLLGEPAHAAQLITTDGDVAYFDDPGCLIHYVADRAPKIHQLWFHDRGAARWLAAADVGFVGGASTPMGYGLAAVPRATAGAIDLAAAQARLLAAPALADAAPGGAP